MKWTEEDIAQVFAMVGAGTSMAVIAKHFGCTRCAVIGLYRRERIKRGTLPPVMPRKRILIPETRRDPNPYRDTVDKGGGGRVMPMPTLPEEGLGFVLPPMDPAPEPAPAPVTGAPVGILDVTGCRWPVGEDAAVPGRHTFCNGPQRDGSSYCAEHSKARVAEGSRETIRQTIRSSLHLVRKARAA